MRATIRFKEAISNRPWGDVDKSKLPKSCFLWVEGETKDTWHLPYREGAGGLDPETGMYRQAGPINRHAIAAIGQSLAGARTGKAMSVPSGVRARYEALKKKVEAESA